MAGLWGAYRRRRPRTQLLIAGLVIVVAASAMGRDAPTGRPGLVIGGSSTTTEAPPTTAGRAGGDVLVVTKHVDGDTLRVNGSERVRFIGMDTPETTNGRRDCFGPEASARVAELLPLGSEVRLEYDVSRLDRFGRTLAYVYRASDGLFINASLLRDGYAQVMTVPPNVAHADEFLALQREAREAGRGFWGACGGGRG